MGDQGGQYRLFEKKLKACESKSKRILLEFFSGFNGRRNLKRFGIVISLFFILNRKMMVTVICPLRQNLLNFFPIELIYHCKNLHGFGKCKNAISILGN